MPIGVMWAMSAWTNLNIEVTLAISILNIYHLFLPRRHASHLTNSVSSGSITSGTVTIILIKILHPK